ncbi:MAG: 5-methyltetrahydropteroyltriglutamate--homocysteine methyltransferase [Alphaproteobacteria bacterium]|nr:MAG: 5-methyltetrahydropteroyltriglutamate--homocysteine methyltransferase [Alphaproteobacteria bacterium]
MTATLLPTTVVGSYPQPGWLIDRDKLTHLPPVRIRAQDLWRVPEPWLEAAQDDATLIAIRDMERAGIDIITDGEIRRESYSNRFATALSGVDLDNPATVQGRSSGTVVVPRIVGPIRRLRPVEVRDVEFLRANTERTIKITLPGPFTMSRQAKNEYYKDEEELVMDYAAAVNEEVRDLKAAGADVIQLDEPWLQARAEEARRLALPAIDRALEGIPGPTALHLCFGYAYVSRDKPNGYAFLSELTATRVGQISIEAAQPNLDLKTLDALGGKTVIFGVISMGDPEPETPDTVAARIRATLAHLPPERLIPAPDCGMKYIPRETAFAKLKALAEGAAIVRRELSGG